MTVMLAQTLRAFRKHLLEILFPPQKRDCPHCGGVHCFGLCAVKDTPDQAGASSENRCGAETKNGPGAGSAL